MLNILKNPAIENYSESITQLYLSPTASFSTHLTSKMHSLRNVSNQKEKKKTSSIGSQCAHNDHMNFMPLFPKFLDECESGGSTQVVECQNPKRNKQNP